MTSTLKHVEQSAADSTSLVRYESAHDTPDHVPRQLIAYDDTGAYILRHSTRPTCPTQRERDYWPSTTVGG